MEALHEREELVEKASKIISHGPPALPEGNRKPKKQSSQTTVYYRNPEVVAYVLVKADGHCELCGKPAPFMRSDGSAFLEVHHVKALGEDGSDTIQNAAALCPNCHRACHFSDKSSACTEALYFYVERLRRE